jgi:hypothetical protein
MSRVPMSSQSLLGGLASCGVCGGGMVLSSTRGGRPQDRWSQYRCPKAGHVGVSGPFLERYVAECVVDMVDTTKLVQTLRDRREAGEHRSRAVSDLEARIEVLQDDYYVGGKVTAARFERLHTALVEQLAEARRAERADGVDIPEELARDLGARWDSLDVTTRRGIIRAVLRDIVVAKATTHGRITEGEKRVQLVWRMAEDS